MGGRYRGLASMFSSKFVPMIVQISFGEQGILDSLPFVVAALEINIRVCFSKR